MTTARSHKKKKNCLRIVFCFDKNNAFFYFETIKKIVDYSKLKSERGDMLIANTFFNQEIAVIHVNNLNSIWYWKGSGVRRAVGVQRWFGLPVKGCKAERGCAIRSFKQREIRTPLSVCRRRLTVADSNRNVSFGHQRQDGCEHTNGPVQLILPVVIIICNMWCVF